LPVVALTFVSEDSLVAAGHDCQPILFSGSVNGWSATGTLDDTSSPKAGGAAKSTPVGRLNSAAFNTFRNADSRGVTGSSTLASGGGGGPGDTTELSTIHQNTITSVRQYAPGYVSTSGVDGKLVIWDAAKVGKLTGLMAKMTV
jgi:actin related protein 2/3 complex subunit 1A/1B